MAMLKLIRQDTMLKTIKRLILLRELTLQNIVTVLFHRSLPNPNHHSKHNMRRLLYNKLSRAHLLKLRATMPQLEQPTICGA
jgi:hypothetical protein